MLRAWPGTAGFRCSKNIFRSSLLLCSALLSVAALSSDSLFLCGDKVPLTLILSYQPRKPWEKSFSRLTQAGSWTYLWTNHCDQGGGGDGSGVRPAQTAWTQSDMILNVVRKKAQAKSGIKWLDMEKKLNKDELRSDCW